MKLENQVIFLVSPEPWGSHFLSKHHYAMHLQKKNQVIFITQGEGGISEGPEGIVLLSFKPVPGGRFLPKKLRAASDRKVWKKISKMRPRNLPKGTEIKSH